MNLRSALLGALLHVRGDVAEQRVGPAVAQRVAQHAVPGARRVERRDEPVQQAEVGVERRSEGRRLVARVSDDVKQQVARLAQVTRSANNNQFVLLNVGHSVATIIRYMYDNCTIIWGLKR